MLSYILPFLALILVVVFIHEYGHYYFAKRFGVGITDFSIGFGKELFGWNDKSGTRWKICMIPLGGYVKFFGDRNVYSQADNEKIIKEYSKEDQDKLFVLKPLYQRALIVFGGPLANFLLAILIFFFVYTFAGKDFTPAVINEVQKNSPAMTAGLKDNDIIVSIDGNKVKSIMEVSKFIMMSTDEIISFTVNRYDQDLIFRVKPNLVDSEDNLGNKITKRMVGIKLGAYNNEINHVKLGPTKAIFYALQHSQESRNYGEAYNRKSEFINKEGIENIHTCPMPDFFLVHGQQYRNILSEFYPNNRIYTIGSLKVKHFMDINRNRIQKSEIDQIIGDINRKVILVALSSNDAWFVLSLLSQWNPKNDILILVTVHSASNINWIKHKISKDLSHLQVKLIMHVSSWVLLPYTNALVCGYSSLIYETLFFMEYSCFFIFFFFNLKR